MFTASVEVESGGLMTSAQVAELLGCSVSGLSRWRANGRGPVELEDALVWLSPSAPRYRRAHVMAYVEGR